MDLNNPPRDFQDTPTDKSEIKKIIFGGFAKCCYPFQKFDSVEGELSFARILERDSSVLRWVKPAPGFFRIEYLNGRNYEPDFVVETDTDKYLCEIKRASEMKNNIVLAKQKAANEWCGHATQHALANGSKPWCYVLFPHDALSPSRSFKELINQFTHQIEPA